MNGRERLRRALGIDYPQGDRTAQPSGHMPAGGHFFDAIIRQPPIDEDHLDPADNLEEFGPVAAADLDHYRRASGAAAATGHGVAAVFGGTSFGDIALENLAHFREAAGDRVDAVFVCGTDFGTQIGQFCSPRVFDDLWLPVYTAA